MTVQDCCDLMKLKHGKDKDRGVPALIAITAACTVPGFQ
jgi:hypothetical protein